MAPESIAAHTFRALDALTKDYPPLLRQRAPYWRPTPPACSKQIHVPAWSWQRDEMDDQIDPQELSVLDVNGAYLAPLSGCEWAHGELQHTGPKDFDAWPGYWLIDTHRWSDDRIVSPLGSGRIPARAWVTTPTLKLLTELQDEGFWPAFTVYDSWTCDTKCRPTKWAAWLREQRAAALDVRGEQPQVYDAVKLGYSQAIQLLMGPTEGKERKSSVIRPDWGQSLRAQHAANTWRKAWRLLSHGIIIMEMSTVDEIVVWSEDLPYITKLIEKYGPKAPIQLDQDGYKLGAFKVKQREVRP